MKIKDLILRILSFPVVAILFFMAMIMAYLEWVRKYLLYGGEFIIYEDKNERKTIKDIYLMMKEKNKE